jgi:hypothetical protein
MTFSSLFTKVTNDNDNNKEINMEETEQDRLGDAILRFDKED